MNKENISVGDTNKKAWCKPVIRVVELETVEILAGSTKNASLQSMDEDDWFIEDDNAGGNGGGNEDGGQIF